MLFLYVSIFAVLAILKPNFVNSRSVIHHYGALNPALIRKGGYPHGEALPVDDSFVQLSKLEDEFLEGIADRICNFLEKNGYNLSNSTTDLQNLSTFLEGFGKSKADKGDNNNGFFKGLKNFFNKSKSHVSGLFHKNKAAIYQVAKSSILSFIKQFLVSELRRNLPNIEKMNEIALGNLNPSVRIAISPTIYRIWVHIFEKYNVPLPEDFSVEEFITKGLNDAERKAVKHAIADAQKSAPPKAPEPQEPATDNESVEDVILDDVDGAVPADEIIPEAEDAAEEATEAAA